MRGSIAAILVFVIDGFAAHLVPGKALTREIDAGAVQEYEIEARAGEYVEFRLDPLGTGVEFAVARGDATLARKRLPAGSMVASSHCWLSRSGDSHSLSIRSLEKRGRRTYSISLIVRASTASDGARVNGCALLASDTEGSDQQIRQLRLASEQFELAGDLARQAETLSLLGRVLWNQGKTAESLASHERAVRMWASSGDLRRQAGALQLLGEGYQASNRYADAMASFERAETLARSVNDAALEADALASRAVAIARQGRYPEAVRLCERSIELKTAAADRAGLANAENLFGIIQQNAGSIHEARQRYERALELRRELGDEAAEAQSLNNLSTVYRQLGELARANEALREALHIRIRVGDPQAVAVTQHNLGVGYVQSGEYDSALGMLEKALAGWRSTNGKRGEAAALTEIGSVYSRLGLYDLAERRYRESLAIRRTLNDRLGEAQALIGIGSILRDIKRYEESEKQLLVARDIARAAKFAQEELRAVQGLGLTHSAMGRHSKAIAELREAVTQAREVNRGDMVSTQTLLGLALWRASETDAASALLEESLAGAKAIESRQHEAAARAALAMVRASRGKIEEARSDVLAAIGLYEDVRAGVASPLWRAQYLSRRQDIYRLGVDILMRGGKVREAFALSERGRARSLHDTVSARSGSGGASNAEANALRSQLRARAEQLTRLLARPETKAADTRRLREEIDSLVQAYDVLRARIAREDQSYAKSSEPVALDAIQKHLKTGDLLIEYSLGNERSYAWMVTQHSIRAATLPPRSELEALVSRIRSAIEENSRTMAETSEQRGRRLRIAASEAGKLSLQLRTLLLDVGSEPVRRLYIAADGELHFLPFSMLPAAPMEIAMLPSASALEYLPVRETRSRSVAIFADPVYETGDARFGGNSIEASAPMEPGLRAESELLRFSRLRFSGEEAEAIASMVPASSRLLATGFAANREAVLRAQLNRYGILHFAAHGLINERQPELSGMVLSLYDERKQQRDGFLRAAEMDQLRLSSQLVVLSACQTAAGRYLDGEGVLGLSRTLIGAGASGVVASHWAVDDRATAYFMRAFYEGLMKRGLEPAAALRRAQQAVRSRPEWASPSYWAAFVYLGR